MSSNLINLIITIFGAFICSAYAYLLTRKSDKTKLTLEFHKEFYGLEMSKLRREADYCIKKYPEAKYDELENLDYEGSKSVIAIMMFFQRLWHCARTNQLNSQMAGDLFLNIFCYWYVVSFYDNLTKTDRSWTAKEEMPDLFSWLNNQYTQIDYKI